MGLIKRCYMFEIEKLGNLELADSCLAVELRVLHAVGDINDEDFNNDQRTTYDYDYLLECKQLLSEQNDVCLKCQKKTVDLLYGNISIYQKYRIINTLSNDDKLDFALLSLLVQEITRRGFEIRDEDWYFKMVSKPTYIREIKATNSLGGLPIDLNHPESIDVDYDINYITFDYPVRKACSILNKKGYVTYWSSANIEDFEETGIHEIKSKRGEESVVKNKRVAYILIDPNNLTDELKQKLFLDGICEFWGAAFERDDNGKYYGIWSEITSLDMRCDDLRDALAEKALSLPELEKKKVTLQIR